MALLRPLRAAAAADDMAAAPPPGSAALVASSPVYRRYGLGEALPRLLARLPDPRAVPTAAWRAGADVADAALRDAALALVLALLRPLWAAAPPRAYAQLLRAWAAGGEAAPGGDDVAALARGELRAAQEAAERESPDEQEAAWGDDDCEPGWTLRGLLGGNTNVAPAAVTRKRSAAAAAAEDDAGPRAWQRRPRLQL